MTRPSAHSLQGAENALLKARVPVHTQTIQIQKEFAIPILPLGCVATGTKMVALVRLQIQLLSSGCQRLHSTACNYQALENRCQRLEFEAGKLKMPCSLCMHIKNGCIIPGWSLRFG